MTSGPGFTDREVNLIVRSLPKDILQPRIKLLPDILREWRRIDVTDHFSWESPEIIAKRRKRVEKA